MNGGGTTGYHMACYVQKEVAEVCLKCRRPTCTSEAEGCDKYKRAVALVNGKRREGRRKK